jgi:hypothetical protein
MLARLTRHSSARLAGFSLSLACAAYASRALSSTRCLSSNFGRAWTNPWRLGRLPFVMNGSLYAMGSEPVIVMEMVLCLQGLATIPWLKPEDYIYFSDHAYHEHTAELADVLLSLPQDRR